jgi:hypothetical protein
MPSGGMMNAQNVLTNRVKLIFNTRMLRIREEIYLQIVKQIEGNISQESIKKLLKFLCLVVNIFPPSE